MSLGDWRNPSHGAVLGQFSVVSPEEQHKRALEATRENMREQGQVMVATLDNNRNLWNTNKLLKERVRALEGAQADARYYRQKWEERGQELSELKDKLDAIPELAERTALLAANDDLKAEVEQLRRALTLMQYPEINATERKELLERLKVQAQELKASGLVPTEQQMEERDARLDEKFGALNVLPGETAEQFDRRLVQQSGNPEMGRAAALLRQRS